MRSICVALLSCALVVSAADHFYWGTATAAYQVEGSRNVSGRQPSVWDCFDTNMVGGANGVPCEAIQSSKPNKANNIFHSENAETADNDYTDYPKTVAELNKYGFGAYRMSISWSRVLSYKTSDGGKLVAVENKEGIEHYRQVLNALQAANVEVALTMWHWDTPEALENYAYHNPACISANSTTGSYWLCPDSNTYFQEYAELLVREFGPLAKFWNEGKAPMTQEQLFLGPRKFLSYRT